MNRSEQVCPGAALLGWSVAVVWQEGNWSLFPVPAHAQFQTDPCQHCVTHVPWPGLSQPGSLWLGLTPDTHNTDLTCVPAHEDCTRFFSCGCGLNAVAACQCHLLCRELSCGLQLRLWVLWKTTPSLSQVFPCSACPEVFKRRMELRLHMVSHTGEMPYKVSRACLQHP